MNGRRNFLILAMVVAGGLWGGVASAQDDTGTLEPPGAPDAGEQVIHLHMPVHHRASPGESKPAASAPARVDEIPEQTSPDSTAPAPVPDAKPQGKATIAASSAAHREIAEPAPLRPQPAAQATTAKGRPAIPFSFGENSDEATTAAPPPESAVRTASIPPRAESVHATPPPATGDDHAGLVKRGAVLFEKGVSDPSPAQFKGVKLLAGDLSAALESGATRVQLEAYGGPPGDKSSDARRLSLRRALAVRQLLIDNGVPSSRIDVRAMGGIDDKGSADRVDVFVRTG